MKNATETIEPKIFKIKGREFTEEELAAVLDKLTVSPTFAAPPLPEVPPGHMRLAKCYVRMNKLGSGVFVSDITPAEAMCLVGDFHAEAGGNPVEQLVETGTVERSPEDERERLCAKYGKRIEKVFPGGIPNMPDTFQRAVKIGLGVTFPNRALVEHDMTAAK